MLAFYTDNARTQLPWTKYCASTISKRTEDAAIIYQMWAVPEPKLTKSHRPNCSTRVPLAEAARAESSTA